MKKYFTLQIFSSDGMTAITRRISKRFLVFIFSLLSLLVLGIIFLVVFYGKVYVKAMKVNNLEERNEYLEGEFNKMEILENDIKTISKQREKLEVALGVDERKRDMKIKNPIPKENKKDTKGDSNGSLFKNPEMKAYFNESKNKSRYIPNLIPVNGWITKTFDAVHQAVDIAAPAGTPIVSSMDGVVTYTGWDSILGNIVKVKGVSEYTTLYGHCEKIFVENGDFVGKGKIIATVGKTGRTEAPHLHYELKMNGEYVNPEFFFIKGSKK